MRTKRWLFFWAARGPVIAAAAVAAPAALAAGWIFGSPYPAKRLDRQLIPSLRVYDRSGRLMREFAGEHGRFSTWVSLRDVSPHGVKATIISEDKRFYGHRGVDARAVLRAARDNLVHRRIVSGASTITMQLARLVRPGRRGFKNKFREAADAVRLERRFTKRQILEQYLNRAPYGHGAVGIEAASRLYFRKPAAQLSLAEAAFLAVIPRSPERYSPYRHFHRTKTEQVSLLRRMAAEGAITGSEMRAAMDERITVHPWRTPFHAPHFTRRVRELVTKAARGRRVRSVTTTLDLSLQEEVKRIVTDALAPLHTRSVTNAAVVVMENRTGEILAWVGSKDFSDAAIQGQVDGVISERQPGSTLKPFVYAMAFEKGYTAASIVPDIEHVYRLGPGVSFRPRNYDNQHHGPVRLRAALASSLNVAAIRVAGWVGADQMLERFKDLGFNSLNRRIGTYGLGLAVGNGEVTLLELVAAYAALARNGLYRSPTLYRFATDLEGRRFPAPASPPRRVFKERVAYLVTHVLSDPMARIRGFGLYTPFNFPFQVAVKTGTSNNWRDNWTVGYTPYVTVGVWVGNFDGRPMHNVSGVTGAGPVFREVMLAAMKTRPKNGFETEALFVSRGICPLSGQLAGPDCPNRMREIFLPGTEPDRLCAYHQRLNVDRRNGLLAGAGCPHRFVRSVVHVLYPPRYAEWARRYGIVPAPVRHSPHCPRRGARWARKPHITAPAHNGRYLIDPSRPATYQTVPLRATIYGGVEQVTWLVDGRPYRTVHWPYSAQWTLARGTHTIAVSAAGRLSDPVEIVVK